MAAGPPAAGPALLADIGGTNARFALWRDGRIEDRATSPTAAHPGLAEAAEAFLAGREIATAAIAVAGPVGSGTGDTRIALTNCGWTFTPDEIAAALGIGRVRVVNDFTAQALALPHYRPGDLRQVGPGIAAPDAPRAVLGPGTGLGVSGVVPSPAGWLALSTEGGHVTLPAATREEAEIVARLRDRFGHVSAERVLSGPGLLNLAGAVADIAGETCPYEAPGEVTEAATAGGDPLAVRTLALFCDFLGTVAADVALSLGATGGVYVSGGIVPALGEAFAASGFRKRFEDKGRFAGWLRAVPTWVVTAETPAFIGLQALAEEMAGD